MTSWDSILKPFFLISLMFHGLWSACGAFVGFLDPPRRLPCCTWMELSTLTRTQWEEHPVSAWSSILSSDNSSRWRWPGKQIRWNGCCFCSLRDIYPFCLVRCINTLSILGRSCSDFLLYKFPGIPDVPVDSCFLHLFTFFFFLVLAAPSIF